MVDTAAAVNILPQEIFLQLPKRIQRKLSTKKIPRIVGVTNTTLSPTGSLIANFITLHGNYNYPIELVVTKNGPPRLLIGGPFIKKQISAIDIENSNLHFRSGQIAKIIPFTPIDAHVYVVRFSTTFTNGKPPIDGPYEKEKGKITEISADENWTKKNFSKKVKNRTEQKINRPLPDAGDWVLQWVGETPACDKEQRNKFLALIMKYHEAFSKTDDDIGCYKNGKVTVRFTDTTPFMAPIYRIPHNLLPGAKKIIEGWCDRGIAEPATMADYTMPVFCIMKKERDPDGNPKTRLIIDARLYNSRVAVTPMPVDDMLTSLEAAGRFAIFNSCDQSSGFLQLCFDEESLKYNAIRTEMGVFRLKRVFLGYKNGPSEFVKAMRDTLAPMLGTKCASYIDDAICGGSDFKTTYDNMEEFLTRNWLAGLKQNLRKCQFMQHKVKFIGHEISKEGRRPLSDKVAAMRNTPLPKTAAALHSFVCAASFYRTYVRNFSHIVDPLLSLLRMPKEMREERRKVRKQEKEQIQAEIEEKEKIHGQVEPGVTRTQQEIEKRPKEKSYAHSKRVLKWNPEAEASFKQLREALSSSPVLKRPEYDKPFIMLTDASDYAISASLNQRNPVLLAPIAYHSQTLDEAQRSWPINSRELEAVCYGLEKFRHYILGSKFVTECWVDNLALKTLLTQKNPISRVIRRLDFLSEYSIKFVWIAGQNHSVPDFLSRYSADIGAVLDAGEFSMFTPQQVKDAQEQDALVSVFKNSILHEQLPPPGTSSDTDYTTLAREFKSLSIENGVLIRTSGDGGKQIIVPTALRPIFLRIAHHNFGHQGTPKTLARLKQDAWWPNMDGHVQNYVKSCDTCQSKKTPRIKRQGELFPISIGADRPLSYVAMDHKKLPLSPEGFQFLLVIVDLFTSYIVLVPVKSESAKDTANALMQFWIGIFGLPEKLLSDNGSAFKNKLMTELSQSLGFKKQFTTSYHPCTDGKAEKVVQIASETLAMICHDEVTAWPQACPIVQYSYNSSLHGTMKLSPAEALFGFKLRTPLSFKTGEPSWNASEEFVKKRQKYIARLWEFIKERSSIDKQRMKDRRALTAGGPVYKIGSVVRSYLTHTVPGVFESFRYKWSGPAKVIEVLPGGAFRISEIATGKVRTVNYALLKPAFVQKQIEESLSEGESITSAKSDTDSGKRPIFKQRNVGKTLQNSVDRPSSRNGDDSTEGVGSENDRRIRKIYGKKTSKISSTRLSDKNRDGEAGSRFAGDRFGKPTLKRKKFLYTRGQRQQLFSQSARARSDRDQALERRKAGPTTRSMTRVKATEPEKEKELEEKENLSDTGEESQRIQRLEGQKNLVDEAAVHPDRLDNSISREKTDMVTEHEVGSGVQFKETTPQKDAIPEEELQSCEKRDSEKFELEEGEKEPLQMDMAAGTMESNEFAPLFIQSEQSQSLPLSSQKESTPPRLHRKFTEKTSQSESEKTESETEKGKRRITRKNMEIMSKKSEEHDSAPYKNTRLRVGRNMLLNKKVTVHENVSASENEKIRLEKIRKKSYVDAAKAPSMKTGSVKAHIKNMQSRKTDKESTTALEQERGSKNTDPAKKLPEPSANARSRQLVDRTKKPATLPTRRQPARQVKLKDKK